MTCYTHTLSNSSITSLVSCLFSTHASRFVLSFFLFLSFYCIRFPLLLLSSPPFSSLSFPGSLLLPLPFFVFHLFSRHLVHIRRIISPQPADVHEVPGVRVLLRRGRMGGPSSSRRRRAVPSSSTTMANSCSILAKRQQLFSPEIPISAKSYLRRDANAQRRVRRSDLLVSICEEDMPWAGPWGLRRRPASGARRKAA